MPRKTKSKKPQISYVKNTQEIATMMGSKGCKGGNEFDCLPRNARRKIKLSPREIRAAKRSFWKRKRREAKAEIRKEAAG